MIEFRYNGDVECRVCHNARFVYDAMRVKVGQERVTTAFEEQLRRVRYSLTAGKTVRVAAWMTAHIG